MIGCFGEVVMDLLDQGDGRFFRALPGGSPANVARVLSRLSTPVRFIGQVSMDRFGEDIMGELIDCGVDTKLVVRDTRPTSVAFVGSATKAASYSFLCENSADRHYQARPEEVELDGLCIAHFGSNSLVLEPASSSFLRLAHAASERIVLSLDPNVRPGIVADPPRYRAAILELARAAAIVKLSEADLCFLVPKVEPLEAARELARQGPELVVLSLGEKGAVSWISGTERHYRALSVPVADTVGAGDALSAGLLAGIHAQGLVTKERLRHAPGAALDAAVRAGLALAAACCTRPGAVALSLGEVRGALGDRAQVLERTVQEP